MLRLLLIAALASTAFGSLYRETNFRFLNGRIVGGQNASIENYNYQGVLLFGESFFCGLAIISPNYAVTAAHCTYGLSPQWLNVRVGSSRPETGGQVYAVSSIYVHPQYNDTTIDYDVSVLELASPIEFDETVGPVSVSTNPTVGGEIATISGFGVLEEDGELPEVLQVAEVPVVAREECRLYMGDFITDRMLCAGFAEGGVDACQGDSGGPLVVNGSLAGIVSWGFGCAAPNAFGVYTDVASVVDFIYEVTNL